MANEKPMDVSIHPRVVKSSQNQIGRTVHDKVNTSKKPNADGIRAKIERMTAHMQRHPGDGTTSSHIRKLKDRIGA